MGNEEGAEEVNEVLALTCGVVCVAILVLMVVEVGRGASVEREGPARAAVDLGPVRLTVDVPRLLKPIMGGKRGRDSREGGDLLPAAMLLLDS